MFVDVPAFAAAAAALCGSITADVKYHLQRFLDDFRERIGFGRPAEPGEPLRWLLHVNPFRRSEDGVRLARGLAIAGHRCSTAERARSAVTWRIRNAIKKTASAHPRRGRHLKKSIRAGTFCVYEPEVATDWVL
jgi:hypothetical protein